MLCTPSVLNPITSLTGGKKLDIFLGGRATLLILCLASILLGRPYVVWVHSMYEVEVGLSLVLVVHVAGFMLVISLEGCIHYP